MKLLPLIFVSGCSLLTACGGGGGSSSSTPDTEEEVLVGAFLDSAVNNLSYSSPSYSGSTDILGTFEYAEGETITFSYLGLVIGTVTMTPSKNIITPLELVGVTDTDNQTVKNLVVMLQSMDIDKDPDNGIELSPAIEADLSGLDITSPTFTDDLVSELSDQGTAIELVDEADALDHFELTLQGMDASSLQLVGNWAERSAGGEISSLITFNSSGELSSTRFVNCSDNDEFIAASVQSAQRNCSSQSSSYRWELSGSTIIIRDGDTVADRCSIRKSSAYMIQATCMTDAFVRFERQITTLSPALIAASYRNIHNSGDSYANLTFNNDQQGGGYQYVNSGNDLSNSGTFTSWSASGTSLSVTGTDGANDAFNTTYTVQSAFNGALIVDSGDDVSALIPDFKDNLASNMTFRNLKVFDAISGKCKRLMFSQSDTNQPTQDTLVYRDPVSEEICDPGNMEDIPVGTEATTYTFNIIDADYITLEHGDYERRCDPIDRVYGDNTGAYWYMACSTSNASVENQIELEIWYNAY
ncbi:hypothetical protein [Thalassolituus sp. UBA2009]|uniref:hypothetical protein n=1 Tax=Thalassolituus sp. UBA2009 TaxID=1947658 RepID=UPI00257C801D|nr:hypothetical protein [Thalassolituus sp. UBA2009]